MICLKWSIVRPSPLICSSYCLVFSETIAVLVPRPLATVKRDSKFIHFSIGFKRQEHKVCWCKFEILPPAMASRSKQTPALFQQFWELFWALPINVHFLFYIKSCLQFSLRCQPIKLWIIFFNKAQLLWCSTHQYIIVQVSFCCSLLVLGFNPKFNAVYFAHLSRLYLALTKTKTNTKTNLFWSAPHSRSSLLIMLGLMLRTSLKLLHAPFWLSRHYSLTSSLFVRYQFFPLWFTCSALLKSEELVF